MLDFDQAVALIAQSRPRLIGIDGLPVAGKSSLADRIAATTGAEVISLDEFVLPALEWRGRAAPEFPFPYMRYSEFLRAVTTLAVERRCTYRPYDWAAGITSDASRTVSLETPVVIEGVSILHPSLTSHYSLRLWVESDASTTLAASLERGVGDWQREWRELFLPSVSIYLDTDPRSRADVLVKGRGCT